MAILGGMHIGVYTPGGAAVMPGAERGPTDFWLYDFEVGLLATAEGDGTPSTLDETVASLNGIGITRNGLPITVDDLVGALHDETTAALAKPGAPRSFTFRVIRELGLRAPQPYDLATTLPAAQITVGPLASFLILADLTLPIVYAVPLQAKGEGLIAGTRAAFANGLLTGDACDQIAGRDLPILETAIEWLVNQKSNYSVWRQSIVDALHHALDQLHFRMTLAFPKEIHYSHGETTPESLYVSVDLRGKVPPDAIACGALHGLTLPQTIADFDGTPVGWDTADLTKHGRVDCPPDTCAVLKNGSALLNLYPKTERKPVGFGPFHMDTVRVPVTIQLSKDLDLPTLSLSQAIDITWHQSYTITFKMQSTIRDTLLYNVSTSASGTAMIDSQTETIDGGGNLAVTTTPIAKSGCHLTATGSGTVAWTVRDLVVDFDAQTVSAIVRPVTPQPIDQYSAPGCANAGILKVYPLPGSLWQQYFVTSHISSVAPFTGWTWKATSQTLLSGGLLAEKTLTEKCGGSLCSGTTVLRVYIDPIAAF